MAQNNSSKSKNTFKAVPRPNKEAAILSDGEDTRKHLQHRNKESFLTRIGLLRMDFEVDDEIKSFNGTASVFSIDQSKNLVYAITCAHNLKYYDPISNESVEAKQVFFERRDTNTPKEYQMSERWIHPEYDAKLAVSKYDLAIIAFKDDGYFENAEQNMKSMDDTSLDKVHIYGYPGEKSGELWGDSKNKTFVKETRKNPDLLQYDIPTTSGQSGSPIIRMTEYKTIDEKIFGGILLGIFMFIMGVCQNFGFTLASSFDIAILVIVIIFGGILYVEQSKNMNVIPKRNVRECKIVGVHTTGNGLGNIGIKLRKGKDSLGWIKQTVTDSIKEGEEDLDTFHCLKETPFL
mmetsp:Transcript_64546/g.58001  ORF Transcript_64546/g.58001 Transcript_64546/m.58001 type:complete len:348 (+) Transcript_64546:52-1095(+)|eukprot:CAMPEP_0201581638 /NCGR_PEP_ID=MMETSP0190_2-20130828/72671_1 /ASSEMBLY_ACC=CAM_ASM_000263 /TAXON_ID=37353 /ORGANISM="Rosalina sp." /LENGTH=347 /DNA_ID=CAMNT_0048020037 /DNA_START=42 /DNA_END=1085 /DNA_ORIENTATION=-